MYHHNNHVQSWPCRANRDCQMDYSINYPTHIFLPHRVKKNNKFKEWLQVELLWDVVIPEECPALVCTGFQEEHLNYYSSVWLFFGVFFCLTDVFRGHMYYIYSILAGLYLFCKQPLKMAFLPLLLFLRQLALLSMYPFTEPCIEVYFTHKLATVSSSPPSAPAPRSRLPVPHTRPSLTCDFPA